MRKKLCIQELILMMELSERLVMYDEKFKSCNNDGNMRQKKQIKFNKEVIVFGGTILILKVALKVEQVKVRLFLVKY